MNDSSAMTSVAKQPLFSCDVLYIGTVVPTETVSGLNAFKMPLRERYHPRNGQLLGVEAILTVNSNGILLLCNGRHDPGSSSWFPIQTLDSCAALRASRCSSSSGELDFHWIDPSGTGDTTHPPIFGFISRRTKGLKVLECHLFVSRTESDALGLVDACRYAYTTTTTTSNDKGYRTEGGQSFEDGSLSRLVAADSFESDFRSNESGRVGETQNTSPTRMPLHGYFYTDRKDLVRKYNIYGKENWGTSSRDQHHLQVPSTSPQNTRYYNNSGPIPAGFVTHCSNPYISTPSLFIPEKSSYQGTLDNRRDNDNKVSRAGLPRTKTRESSRTKRSDDEVEVVEHYYYVRPHHLPTTENGHIRYGDWYAEYRYPTGTSYYNRENVPYSQKYQVMPYNYRQCILKTDMRSRDYLGGASSNGYGCTSTPFTAVPISDPFRSVAGERTMQSNPVPNQVPAEGASKIVTNGTSGNNHRHASRVDTQQTPVKDSSAASKNSEPTRPRSPTPDYPTDTIKNRGHPSESIYAAPLKRKGAKSQPDKKDLKTGDHHQHNSRAKPKNPSHAIDMGDVDTKDRDQRYSKVIEELGYMP